MSPPMDFDVQSAVTAELVALTDLPDPPPDDTWDTPSLCAGWRVRKVVAHMTMPVRHSAAQFQSELRDCDGDFSRLSKLVARRDAAMPAGRLVGNLRDRRPHLWVPPGGGHARALNHVVIHGLDITVRSGSDTAHPTGRSEPYRTT